MKMRISRILATTACLVWLAGCGASTKMAEYFDLKPTPDTTASIDPAETGAISSNNNDPAELPNVNPDQALNSLVGADPTNDVALGKKHYRAGNYGDAEKYFRRAVETSPRDLEAWVGLAASYDRIKRFNLADRAYEQAIKLAGPRPEILNNQGYSYILRGDYKRARDKLRTAKAKDPNNPFIENNLALLEEVQRTGKLPD